MLTIDEVEEHCRYVGKGIEKMVADGGGTPSLPGLQLPLEGVQKLLDYKPKKETTMKKMMIMAAACLMAVAAFAAQCAAKTEDGVQCKRQAEENSKYCWQHIKGAVQCAATTQDGARCKRKAQPGKKYCWQHANYKPAAKAEAKKGEAKPAAKKPAAKPAAKKDEAKKPEAK